MVGKRTNALQARQAMCARVAHQTAI